ncbi:hypothetical protein BCR34DRAFT_64201 [Clohesyomyces aquaticus]|uniref:Uncharacterized protein n=1 Tax=Clohesyomyces aquaticus TaxID=1231657 RepID=A0A1Y1Z2H1_9PLEO|nr:hypothetical protein BCR34DRAFT_64201 [Clohesyomyces aquaticus]
MRCCKHKSMQLGRHGSRSDAGTGGLDVCDASEGSLRAAKQGSGVVTALRTRRAHRRRFSHTSSLVHLGPRDADGAGYPEACRHGRDDGDSGRCMRALSEGCACSGDEGGVRGEGLAVGCGGRRRHSLRDDSSIWQEGFQACRRILCHQLPACVRKKASIPPHLLGALFLAVVPTPQAPRHPGTQAPRAPTDLMHSWSLSLATPSALRSS